jgi:outer membrane lipoprotein carrier protein
MRRFKIIGAFVVLLYSSLSDGVLRRVSSAPASQQGTWTLESVLKQLNTQAGEFRSLTADLDRTKVTVVVNDKSTESGTISIRRDGKMRIELTKPDERTILRDGDNFYIYNPKIHRVEEYNLGGKKSLVDQFLLLGFGTSGDALKQGYAVSLQGEEVVDNIKAIRLELTPKTADVLKQLSRIQLWLDDSTCLPVQQRFDENGSGDYTIVRFKNIVRNPKISDAVFKPHWPRGVTHVKPQV